MIIGVPKETKEHEYRVGLTPEGAGMLSRSGNHVLIEESAGEGSGFSDRDYTASGARVTQRAEVYGQADLIIKVKEPLPPEYDLFRDGQALFTYLHLAPNPDLTSFLLKRNITALAYETLEVDGTLPLLMPMSEVAGRMAPIVAAHFLQRVYGGSGVLMPGAGGTPPANVLVLGAGTVGVNAMKVALGMGARVTLISRKGRRFEAIAETYRDSVRTFVSTRESISAALGESDAVIGAVLIPGAKAPRLILRDQLSDMRKGAVIVDVSVDQGGCFETTRPTTHNDPVYLVDGIVHYAVANMPGAYPRTSTLALTGKTLPYIQALAQDGIESSLIPGKPLRSALNTHGGRIMNDALAESVPGEEKKD